MEFCKYWKAGPCRLAVGTVLLALGHLIWAQSHLVWDSTNPDWLPKFKFYFYRPQTKFAKVMFLHVSVCPRGEGEYLGRYPPGQVHRTDRYPPGRYIPQADTPHPQQVHPQAVHAGRYGQQAGGTHPTGMHSCTENLLTRWDLRGPQYTILKDQNEFHSRQECIPVGCVLSAAVAILGLGCLPRGVSAERGVSA